MGLSLRERDHCWSLSLREGDQCGSVSEGRIRVGLCLREGDQNWEWMAVF